MTSSLRTLGASTALLTLAAGLLLAPVSAAAPGDPLEQTVAPDEATGEGRVVIDSGHVDMGPRVLDGEWTLQLRDDTRSPSVWRSLDDVVLHVPDASILPAPEDAQFDFIDAEAGTDVWVVPQTQNTAVVWAGWNSQHPSAVELMGSGMTLRLHGVQGPGQLTLFLQNGNFAPAQLLWSSDVAEPQDVWAQTNSHVHGNWVFTAPGSYLVDVEVLADLTDGTQASDRQTLRVAVGDATDPETTFAEAWPATTESEAPAASSDDGESDAIDAPSSADTSSSPAATGEPGQPEGAGMPLAAVIAGGAVLVVVAAVAVSMVRAKRARQQAEEQAEEQVDERG